MLYKCTYCIFTLYGRYKRQNSDIAHRLDWPACQIFSDPKPSKHVHKIQSLLTKTWNQLNRTQSFGFWWYLPPPQKMKHVHLQSRANTSMVERTTIILLQSTYILKSYIYTYFDIVDTAFSCERELMVCSFLQDFSKGKGSSLRLICNANTAFFYFVGQKWRRW